MFSSKQIQEMYNKRKLLDKSKTYGKIPPDDSYVYIVQQGHRIVYVGKGTGWRFLHPNSGRSSSIDLNKGHFDGVVYDVYLLKMGMTDSLALVLEDCVIDEFMPVYNNIVKEVMRIRMYGAESGRRILEIASAQQAGQC